MVLFGPFQDHNPTALFRANQRHLSVPHLASLPSDNTNGLPSRTQPKHISEPALKVVSINIEGFSLNKAEILATLSHKLDCDIMCIQETHRGTEQLRPQIPGLSLVAEIPHTKHGSAIFTKPNISIKSVSCNSHNAIETLTIDTGHCTVTSIYKPPNQPFIFSETNNFRNQPFKIIVGDFNSHNTTWGYRDTNADGTAVEEWAEAENLQLNHDAKLPPSFNSGRWKRGYNPDLIFVSSNIKTICSKAICDPIPHTQHRPILCLVHAAIKPTTVPFRRRFNFQKANWDKFAKYIDDKLLHLEPTPQNYDKFVEIVWTVSRQSIPRGCRTRYIPGLNQNSASLLDKYEKLYTTDPFSTETIVAGEELMNKLSENRRERWVTTMSNIDMTHNSKKAWSTLRKLTGDPPEPSNPGKVTANQIAHQLLLNGKAPQRLPKVPKPKQNANNSSDISKPFTLTEIVQTIKGLKNGKAAGVDDITVEQLKNLGPIAVSWLLEVFNSCLKKTKLPKLWRRSKVIALLKPGKPPTDPKSYRPISLLCHTFKLFERLLLNRLTPIAESKLIPEQAGFRPGKSCTSQVLRLTQHIENGYETKKITGAVFVDLSAAYDTINIKRLISKMTSLIDDQAFLNILREMLTNRRFQVQINNQSSRWRRQKNGLPQGSVLAPILFNIFTNDQPCPPNTERFLYADDLALTTQTTSFEEAETVLTGALEIIGKYYDENSLKPNPSKTQSCAFHLRNREANRSLKIPWKGVDIEHSKNPTYLGVKLDRALTYKPHCLKTKLKVNTRNNLLSRLTSTTWGAAAQVVRTSGLALCFSAGEYACPVWHRSAHAKEVDVALNETCRKITGCLKPTPLNLLYPLAGIAPPKIRRSIACSIEKQKLENDSRHPLHKSIPPDSRLKSRKDFLSCTKALSSHPKEARYTRWLESCPPPQEFMDPAEELPPGSDLPWPTWKSLNRLRTQVGRCKSNMVKWGYSHAGSVLCGCGEAQTMAHLLSCPQCPNNCTLSDLMEASPLGVAVADYWSGTV